MKQIMNAILIANECVESRQRSLKPEIICKLDIQKAYDHLNRNFHSYASKNGVGTKWIKWIKHCIITVSFSVLFNRTPNGFLPSQRGLRQGDPISPFFILAMKGMSNVINTAKLKGRITHLQSDDTLVFCEAVENQILILRVIFILFEAVSGLHINWEGPYTSH